MIVVALWMMGFAWAVWRVVKAEEEVTRADRGWVDDDDVERDR